MTLEIATSLLAPRPPDWRALAAYWRSKCIDGRPPSRRDIDPPIEIPRLTQYLFLIDVDGARFRYRLVGSDIVRWARRNVTGCRVEEDNMDPVEFGSWMRALLRVANTQTPLLGVSKPIETRYRPLILLILPLVDRDGATEMIFGGVFPPVDAKFRSEIEHIRMSGMVEYAIPDDLSDAAAPLGQIGPAETRAARRPEPGLPLQTVRPRLS
jgi:hypothetical protein